MLHVYENIRCEQNPTKRETVEGCESGDLVLATYTKEEQERLVEEARTRAPVCTYCRYHVEHMFKTVKERETHEMVCPNKAAYDRKNAQTETIYNKHKNLIE